MRPLRDTVIPLSLAQLRTLDGCARYDSRTSVESGPRRPVDMPLRRAHSRTTCGRALYRSRNASGSRPRSDTSRPRSRAQARIAAVSVCEDSLTSTAVFYCQMHRYHAKRACSCTASPLRSLDRRGIDCKGGFTATMLHTSDNGVRTRTTHCPTVTSVDPRELERTRAPTDLAAESASAKSRAFPGSQPAGARTRSSSAPAERPDPLDGANRCQYVARPPLMS